MALRSPAIARHSAVLLPVLAVLVLAGTTAAASATPAGSAVTTSTATTGAQRTTTCNPSGGGFLAATASTLSFALNGCLPSSGVGRVNVYGSAAGGTPVGYAEGTTPAGTVTVSGLALGTQYWFDLADGFIRGPVSTVAVTTTTATTTTGGAPVPGTLVKTWDFEDGSLTGFSPAGGTSLAVTNTAHSGRNGLSVRNVNLNVFGPAATLSLDSSPLVPEGLYDLVVPTFVPVNGRATTFRVSVGTVRSAPVQVYPGQWGSALVHVRWGGSGPKPTATISTSTECWPELPQSTAEFSLDDIVLRASLTPDWSGPTSPPCPTLTTSTTTSITTTTTTSRTSTTSSAPPRCTVSYSVVSQWPGGFQGAARLTNSSTGAISPWLLSLTFPDGQKITQSWGTGGFSQTGATVTFSAPGWAPNLAPNATAEVGFNGSWSGQNRAPTAITVSGLPCAATAQ